MTGSGVIFWGRRTAKIGAYVLVPYFLLILYAYIGHSRVILARARISPYEFVRPDCSFLIKSGIHISPEEEAKVREGSWPDRSHELISVENWFKVLGQDGRYLGRSNTFFSKDSCPDGTHEIMSIQTNAERLVCLSIFSTDKDIAQGLKGHWRCVAAGGGIRIFPGESAGSFGIWKQSDLEVIIKNEAGYQPMAFLPTLPFILPLCVGLLAVPGGLLLMLFGWMMRKSES